MNVISYVVALFFSCFVFFQLFSRRIYFLPVRVYLISILKAKNSCYSRDLPFLSFICHCFNRVEMNSQIRQCIFCFLTRLRTTLVLEICNAVKVLYMLPPNIFVAVVVVIIWYLDLQIPMQSSMPITTDVVSSNSAQERCTRYNIIS